MDRIWVIIKSVIGFASFLTMFWWLHRTAFAAKVCLYQNYTIELTMSSRKSRRLSPSTPELKEELWVLRGQLEAGQIAMTRKLMLRVVEEGLNPSAFDNGVNLFAYYVTDVDAETRSKDQFEEAFAQSQAFEEWLDSWYRCARPEWLDVMADILIDPPLGWSLDEQFTELFLNVSGQFPDKAVQVLAVLFSDTKVHPRLANLIETLYAMRFK